MILYGLCEKCQKSNLIDLSPIRHPLGPVKSMTFRLSNDLKALDKELCKRIDVSKDEEGKRILKCKECDKVFTSMHKAKFHVEIHVSGFYHNCDVCGVTYKTRNSLNQHKYTKHTLMNK